MKAELTASGVAAVAGLIVAGALGVWLYRNRALFNPANPGNVVNQGASAAVKAITGGAAKGGEDSVGGVAARVREWVSGDDAKIRDMLKGSATDPNVVTPDDPGTYYGSPGS